MNRDRTLLKIIIKEIDILNTFIKNVDKDNFLTSEALKRAVVMTLINIGEKVKDLSPEIKQQHSNIPWKQISGIRDMAAHAYLQLNFDRVWDTIKTDIPIFKTQLLTIQEEY